MEPRRNTRAFTLIELLVVVAIIGLLSSVVLASLNTARRKAADAGIKETLASMQTQAQIYYTDHSNAYGHNSGPEQSCMATDDYAADPTIYKASGEVVSLNGNGPLSLLCVITPNSQSYAIMAQLASDSSVWWCVDSTGAAKAEPYGLNGIGVSPFWASEGSGKCY